MVVGEVEMGGETTMQSSKEGLAAPRVKGTFGFGGAEGWVSIAPVGIWLESRTR